MPVTDSISDYLTRIRNAMMANHKTVSIPHSKLKEAISKVLEEKGYINGYSVERNNMFSDIKIKLKRLATGTFAIRELTRVSSPGQRVYKGKDVERYLSGIGLYILSTSKGIMSDKEARKVGIGGEVLFRIR